VTKACDIAACVLDQTKIMANESYKTAQHRASS
jgi:hypothetical protein